MSVSVALLRGFAKPLGRGDRVSINAGSLGIDAGKVELRDDMALCGGFTEPFHGLELAASNSP